eukprot:6193922-Pleurochrysis_carterae.AAC.2
MHQECNRPPSNLPCPRKLPQAHRSLSIQFQDRLVTKRYEALVHGWPSAESGTITQPIAKLSVPGAKHSRNAISAAGRPSTTEWYVDAMYTLRSGVRVARVSLLPRTGRPHQLRLHMHWLGHPILGDEIHGKPLESDEVPTAGARCDEMPTGSDEPLTREVTKSDTLDETRLEARLCLHAVRKSHS